MESWKDRVATEARVNMTLGAVHQVASVAIIAIIVFITACSAAVVFSIQPSSDQRHEVTH